MSELPGFRAGSNVLILVNGKTAAERHLFSKSSQGAYLTQDVIEPDLFQAVVDIKSRDAIFWGDWRSMDRSLAMAVWRKSPEEKGAPLASGPSTSPFAEERDPASSNSQTGGDP